MKSGKRFFNSVFVCILIFCKGTAAAQVQAAPNLPGPGEIDENEFMIFYADGSIRSWYIEISPGQKTQIIDDSGPRLLALHLVRNGRDITNEIAWETTSGDVQHSLVFIGKHHSSNLRVIRQYMAGDDENTITTSLQLEFGDLGDDGILEAVLAIPNALGSHLSNDRSLGDYFYNFSRTFYSHGSGNYQRYTGDTALVVDSIAYGSRHVGLRISRISGSSSQQIQLNPTSPAIIGLVVPFSAKTDYRQNGFSTYFSLTAQPMMSSVVVDTDLQIMLFADMWAPFRFVAQLIEKLIQKLQSIVGSLGVAIIAFALFFRLLLLPISIWSVRQQRSFSTVQADMAPKIQEINAAFRGAERSERTLALYKKYKVSPFTGLKGSAALFVQLPILVAFFSITAESALFRDIPFLWISDLSLPDRLYRVPITIPGIGSYVNILPVILGLVSVLASVIQRKSTDATPVKFSRGTLVMVLLIVVFFYSCASALVLYWTVANIAQILEGQYVRYRDLIA